MRPVDTIEGSPSTKPCPNSEMIGTAEEQSVSGNINPMDTAGTSIYTDPVPLSLVVKTISAEIQAHGEDISQISIRRTGQHVYTISLNKTAPQGMVAGQKAGGADAD